MAQTVDTGSQLTPSPRALQKALLQSADRAQRLAQAFGKVVPTEKSKKAAISHNTTDRATRSAH